MDLVESGVCKASRSIPVLNDLSDMWLIFLEAGVALGLLLFIVWWTLPKKPKNPQGHDDKDTGHD